MSSSNFSGRLAFGGGTVQVIDDANTIGAVTGEYSTSGSTGPPRQANRMLSNGPQQQTVESDIIFNNVVGFAAAFQ